MKTASTRGERGLTLIEVMFALLLLSFGLLAIAPLFAGSVKTGASSNQLAGSNTLAREKLEELIGYPATDMRLSVPTGKNSAGPTGVTTTGSGSVVGANTNCDNDLPKWYNPATGATSTASASPGAGWYRFPFQRTYTIEQFSDCPPLQCCGGTNVGAACVNATTCGGGTCPLTDQFVRVTAPAAYAVKKITVTVKATMGPFPGLRQTQQTVFVRFRDAG